MSVDCEATGGVLDRRSGGRVRTFKPRRRGLSPGRQRRFDALAPRWSVPEAPGEAAVVGRRADPGGSKAGGSKPVQRQPEHPEAWFGDARPVVLDIGIGSGESCIEMARNDPSTNIVGVDVYTPGIATALIAIDDLGLKNLRVFHGDVFDLVPRLAPASLEGVRVYFPDPWPKARHHRRRLVSDDRVAELVPLLRPGGWLHLATDSAVYADEMDLVCGGHAELDGGVIARPTTRPLTRFERRGLEDGRAIVDLWFERVGGAPLSERESMTASP